MLFDFNQQTLSLSNILFVNLSSNLQRVYDTSSGVYIVVLHKLQQNHFHFAMNLCVSHTNVAPSMYLLVCL